MGESGASGGQRFGGFNLGSLRDLDLGSLRDLDLGSLDLRNLDLRNLNVGEALDGLREQFEQRAGEFGLGGRGGSRGGQARGGQRRGGRPGAGRSGGRGAHSGDEDVRGAILSLLAEGPMHGADLIRQIGERTGGAWEPSAGTVYPLLQLLVDEGLASVAEADGKRQYSLTEAGTAAAADVTGLPWQAEAEGASDDSEDSDASDGSGDGRCACGGRGGGHCNGHCGGGHHGGTRSALPRAGIRLARAAKQLAVDGTPEQQEQAAEILDEARRKLYALLAEA